jgi:ribosomal protein L44E
MKKTTLLELILVVLLFAAPPSSWAEGKPDYQRAQWDPIHFKPAIDKATNEQCLSCHQEIIGKEIRARSPAGIEAAKSKAWYQRTRTYQGPQMDFHRRHLDGPLAKQLMNMKCTTCHQGNDPREESPSTTGQPNDAFTLRKAVHPDVCLMCHGQMEYQNMGLPEPWSKSAKLFANNCLTCHAAIRTNRHQVNFLKPEAIEQAAAQNSDVCFGCHGGRPWYRIGFPYPRHAWEGMPEEVPEWAKGRPAESQPRFRH